MTETMERPPQNPRPTGPPHREWGLASDSGDVAEILAGDEEFDYMSDIFLVENTASVSKTKKVAAGIKRKQEHLNTLSKKKVSALMTETMESSMGKPIERSNKGYQLLEKFGFKGKEIKEKETGAAADGDGGNVVDINSNISKPSSDPLFSISTGASNTAGSSSGIGVFEKVIVTDAASTTVVAAPAPIPISTRTPLHVLFRDPQNKRGIGVGSGDDMAKRNKIKRELHRQQAQMQQTYMQRQFQESQSHKQERRELLELLRRASRVWEELTAATSASSAASLCCSQHHRSSLDATTAADAESEDEEYECQGADNSESLESLQLRVISLITRLRTEHCYCLHCGCFFDSAEDLAANCPGPAIEDH